MKGHAMAWCYLPTSWRGFSIRARFLRPAVGKKIAGMDLQTIFCGIIIAQVG